MSIPISSGILISNENDGRTPTVGAASLEATTRVYNVAGHFGTDSTWGYRETLL